MLIAKESSATDKSTYIDRFIHKRVFYINQA